MWSDSDRANIGGGAFAGLVSHFTFIESIGQSRCLTGKLYPKTGEADCALIQKMIVRLNGQLVRPEIGLTATV